MLITLALYPTKVFLFSKKNRLPNKNKRIKKTLSPIDDFCLIKDISNEIIIFDNINIIVRGESFDRSQIHNFKRPTFLINWHEKVNGDNIYYATADLNELNKFIKNKMYPIYYCTTLWYEDNSMIYSKLNSHQKIFSNSGNKHIFLYHKSNLATPPLGSALASIIMLLMFSNKANIYGWDQYYNSNISEKSYLSTLFGLCYNYNDRRWGDVIETAIFNLLYASRINELDNINNYGITSFIDGHPRLVNQIESVIYD